MPAPIVTSHSSIRHSCSWRGVHERESVDCGKHVKVKDDSKKPEVREHLR